MKKFGKCSSYCVACEAWQYIGITLSSICLSVGLSVCLSGSHTFLVGMHSYVSQATHVFLGMLPLCLDFYKLMSLYFMLLKLSHYNEVWIRWVFMCGQTDLVVISYIDIGPRKKCTKNLWSEVKVIVKYSVHMLCFNDITQTIYKLVELLSWIVCLTSQLTIFQSYMWRHIDVQADWRRSWTYGRAPNAIDIS